MSLHRFHSFGCRVYCRVPNARIGGKSVGNARAFDGYLLGYSENSEEYRVWDVLARKLRLVSFNMCIFNEGEYPCVGAKVDSKRSFVDVLALEEHGTDSSDDENGSENFLRDLSPVCEVGIDDENGLELIFA